MKLARVIAVATVALAAVPGAAQAHGLLGIPTAPRTTTENTIVLRGCYLTVALVPRPARNLQSAFGAGLEPIATFYGPQPQLALWALACDRADQKGAHDDGVVLSLVGVPTGTTADDPRPPAANVFSHTVGRTDTDSKLLAGALGDAGIAVRLTPRTRYRHSAGAATPASASLKVPGGYGMSMTASLLDQPHDHFNRFLFSRSKAKLDLVTRGANDRFCLPVAGTCHATVSGPAKSLVAKALGAPSADASIAFDHLKIKRIDLTPRR